MDWTAVGCCLKANSASHMVNTACSNVVNRRRSSWVQISMACPFDEWRDMDVPTRMSYVQMVKEPSSSWNKIPTNVPHPEYVIPLQRPTYPSVSMLLVRPPVWRSQLIMHLGLAR